MGAGYRMQARGNRSAEIYIYEDVGESWFGGVTAKQFAEDLRALGAVDTIDVRINSYGGDVFDGLAIYRQLVEHKATVVSHVDGVAASIASVIAMAGSEIRIAEAGFVMIHNAWGVAIGNAEEMRKMAGVLEQTSGSIRDVYAARTSLGDDELATMMANETWLGAAEAIAKGFADTLAENMKIAAHAGAVPQRAHLAKHQFRALPAPLAAQRRPQFDAARARVERQRATITA